MSFYMLFNGVKLPIRITEIEGRGPMMQEVIRQPRPNGAGSFFQKKRSPERPLAVHYKMFPDSLTSTREFVDQLNQTLNVAEPAPIVFSDEPGKTYYGILFGEPYWEESVKRVSGILNFICPDPYKYSVEQTKSLVSGGKIINGGSVETCPIITATFTAPATNFAVTCGGKTVRVIYNFIRNDVLTIDLQKRKVLINGKVNMTAYAWDSRPFSLAVGDNVLTFTVGATVTIKFRERWL